MKQRSLLIGAAVAFLVIFLGAAAWYTTSRNAETTNVAQANLAALDRDHAPSVGPADAPVVIVEFLDPACETCAVFYPMVKNIMASNPESIRLVLRWAPFHAGSPDVVALLEAARRQDSFWPALEQLLATQSAWTANHQADFTLALMQLQNIGLDTDRLLADMMDPEIARLLRQDVADATTLNVSATPEYFVNGKPMPSFGSQQLVTLIEEALEETGR